MLIFQECNSNYCCHPFSTAFLTENKITFKLLNLHTGVEEDVKNIMQMSRPLNLMINHKIIQTQSSDMAIFPDNGRFEISVSNSEK